MALGNAPTSSDGKAIWGAIHNNSGTNQMRPIRAYDATTQNSETVVELGTHDASLIAAIGATSDTPATDDDQSTTLLAFVKRMSQHLSTLIGLVKSMNTGNAATAITVGTSATALPASALSNRRTLTVYNNGTVTIYVGPSGVTTSSGIPVEPGQSFSADLGPSNVLYGISGTASQNVRVWEAS